MQHIAKSRHKALVVEERSVDRDLGVSILGQLGYEAEATASAADALARLGQERFALVLLSATLPDSRACPAAAPRRADLAAHRDRA